MPHCFVSSLQVGFSAGGDFCLVSFTGKANSTWGVSYSIAECLTL